MNLNKEVAEKVMGWTDPPEFYHRRRFQAVYNGTIFEEDWKPTENAEQTLMVVEAMAKKSFSIKIFNSCALGLCCTFKHLGSVDRFSSSDKPITVAICQAAIKACTAKGVE